MEGQLDPSLPAPSLVFFKNLFSQAGISRRVSGDIFVACDGFLYLPEIRQDPGSLRRCPGMSLWLKNWVFGQLHIE
jgi:hypothetical protein